VSAGQGLVARSTQEGQTIKNLNLHQPGLRELVQDRMEGKFRLTREESWKHGGEVPSNP